MIVMHLILLGVAYLALEEISQSVIKSRKLCVSDFLLKRLVGLSYSVQTEITLNTHFSLSLKHVLVKLVKNVNQEDRQTDWVKLDSPFLFLSSFKTPGCSPLISIKDSTLNNQSPTFFFTYVLCFLRPIHMPLCCATYKIHLVGGCCSVCQNVRKASIDSGTKKAF